MRALRVLLLALSVTLVAAGANAGKLAVSASAKPVKVKRQAKRVKRPAQRPTRKLSPKRRSSQLRRSLQRKQVHRRVQPRKVKRGARGSGKGLVFRTGKLKRDVDLVIFDLDGTVAETRQDIATNFNAGFKSIGVEVSMKKLLELVDGSPLEKTYWAVRPKGNEIEMQRFLNGFRSSQKARGPGGKPFDGIPELLTTLRKQPGIKLAIATARPADNAVQMLRKMGLRDHFDIVTGTDGSGMPHKPAPDMLLYVAERTGVSPKRAVFIGDTHTDMMAGKAAGMSTVALTYGMGAPDKLSAQKPDATTGKVRELFNLFGLSRRTGRADRSAKAVGPVLPVRTRVHPVESSDGGPIRRAAAAN